MDKLEKQINEGMDSSLEVFIFRRPFIYLFYDQDFFQMKKVVAFPPPPPPVYFPPNTKTWTGKKKVLTKKLEVGWKTPCFSQKR